MRFKNLLLIPAIVLLISCSGGSQKDIFQKSLSEYLDAYNNTDWQKVTTMIYPKFFLAVRKSQVIESLQMLDSLGMKRNFTLKEIERISEILTEGNELFCRVYYNTGIIATLNRLEEPRVEKFIEDFNEDYGKENVRYDANTLTFTINAHQSVIAVSTKDSDVWKFMELNNEHAFDIVAQVVPKEIMKELTK